MISNIEAEEMKKQLELYEQEKNYKQKKENEQQDLEKNKKIREHQMEAMLALYDIDLELKEMYINELLKRHYSDERKPATFMKNNERRINLNDVMEDYNIKRLDKPRGKKAVREIMEGGECQIKNI